MKKVLLTIFAGVVLFSSCSSISQNSSNEIIKGKSISAKGKVVKVQRGKDGYTADFVSDDDKQYSAVISSVNMQGSGQYREVKIGDVIEVEGEAVSSDNRVIRVVVLK